MEMQESQITEPASTERPAWKLPLILLTVSLLVWFGFQTAQLILERRSLVSVSGNFQSAVQEAQKLRKQLETLITKTAELAKQGNTSAKKAVEELEQKGIPIQTGTPPAK